MIGVKKFFIGFIIVFCWLISFFMPINLIQENTKAKSSFTNEEHNKKQLVQFYDNYDINLEKPIDIPDEPQELFLGANNISLSPDFTYFIFTTDSLGGQYDFTKSSSEYFALKIFTETYTEVPISYIMNNGYHCSFDRNKTYYIGLSSKLENVILEINKLNERYSWIISGGEYGNGYEILEGVIMPKRGYTYNLKYLINGEELNNLRINNEYNPLNDYIVFNNNNLIIKETAPLEQNGLTIYALLTEHIKYMYGLKIIPISAIDIKSYNNNDLGFSYKVPAGTTKFTYSLICDDFTSQEYEVLVPDDNDGKTYFPESILNNYNSLNRTGFENITIRIEKVYFTTAYNEEIVYNESLSVNVQNSFEDGSGTYESPYIISTYRHLNNIRKATDEYFKLSNDISLSANTNWIPIDNFSGVLMGEGHTINPESEYSLLINAPNNIDFIYYGFIRSLSGAVSDLNINGLRISGNVSNSGSRVYVGGIAGYNGGRIVNCQVYGNYSVYGKCSFVGGIVGVNSEGEIRNSNNYADITGHGTLGGVYIQNSSRIVNCNNYGKVNYIFY